MELLLDNFAFSDKDSGYLVFLAGSEYCPYFTMSVNNFHESRGQHALQGFTDVINHIVNNIVETEAYTFSFRRTLRARFSAGVKTDNN